VHHLHHYKTRSLLSLLSRKFFSIVCIFYLTVGFSHSLHAAPGSAYKDSVNEVVESSVRTAALPSYQWNLSQQEQPLLNLPAQINNAAELMFAYPMGQKRFPVFQTLRFDGRSNHYVVKVLSSPGGAAQDVFLKVLEGSNKYVAANGELNLTENQGVKTIRSTGAEYTFSPFADGFDRCVRIKSAGGAMINLVYGKDNMVRGLVDSRGRALRFSYEGGQIVSVTQTWTANAASFNKTWPVGRPREQVKLAHAAAPRPAVAKFSKPIPNNALTTQYTAGMATSDRQLASIFGGPGAVAAANGYEPAALASQYPLYRGDLLAADGHLIRGHLSYAMHLYGNAEGTADSGLYVPAGFTAHSAEPGPTDAAVTFYYPRLGNLTDVTLAVFHVAHFSLKGGVSPVITEDGRVRIGDIGGPGGSVAGYKHSHLEFYRGNTGLPSAAAREHLRIDPSSVFSSNFAIASRARVTATRR
jgi:hypothetical protein